MPSDQPPNDDTSDVIATILDELMDALVALEGTQDEGSPAMQLVQLAAVDVQDAIETLDADPLPDGFDAADELAATSHWLADYRSEQPTIVESLTVLIDGAAARVIQVQTAPRRSSHE